MGLYLDRRSALGFRALPLRPLGPGGRPLGLGPRRPASRPVYAPALVAFIGGAGWNVSVGVGGGGVEAIGWVPLAPEEVYLPTYAVSEDYVRRVNVTNVTKVTTINRVTVNNVTVNNYRNAASVPWSGPRPSAVGAPVKAAVVHVPVETIAAAPAATAVKPPAPPAARPARVSAAPPPAKLQAVRAAVVAHPAGSNKPPVIAGARVAPPRRHTRRPPRPRRPALRRSGARSTSPPPRAASRLPPRRANALSRRPRDPSWRGPPSGPRSPRRSRFRPAGPADRSQTAPAAKPATETPAQAKARPRCSEEETGRGRGGGAGHSVTLERRYSAAWALTLRVMTKSSGLGATVAFQ